MSNIYGTRSRSLLDSNNNVKGGCRVTLNRTRGTEVNHYLLCFYLLTDDYSSPPSDLKTHIIVNKVSWGAFKRANITASRDHKVPLSKLIWLLGNSMKNCQHYSMLIYRVAWRSQSKDSDIQS